MPNHLCSELSPYLLQHAGNPVDWRPWNAAALALARTEQKPILLSIGYASCHWCHVMAHDAFENPEIARLLNEHFVSIKVDREERFDLDQVYMDAVQMLTGRGGWPLSVFLTPDAEPFFGGTYWPAHSRGGMPGFDQVLSAVIEAWQERRPALIEQAHKITEELRRIDAGPQRSPANRAESTSAVGVPVDFDDTPMQEAEAALRRSFDAQWGGFGRAPKFPQPLALRWLLGRWRRSGDDELLRIVTTTLDRMADGGIFDHLGGGFHRYCVDDRWLAPHFEKMLYDNALLAVCYLQAWQATGRDDYAAVVRRTLDYLLRDMTDPQGGFYSGEDADSEGEEGKFYLWTPAEIESVLPPDAAELFCRVYDVSEEGNFEGRNILNLRRPLEVDAKLLGCDPAWLAARLDEARRQLLAARAKRIRPGRDEKVLVGWNSLAIDALARAGAALAEPRYTAAANSAADFLWNHLRRDDGRLLHYWRKGQAKYDAYLDDYAGLGNALLTLHETGGSSAGTVPIFAPAKMGLSPSPRLDQATAVADTILSQFADHEHGGLFYTAADHEPLIVRRKDFFDNPTPSSNGVAVMLLLRLQAICGRDDYLVAAEKAIRAFAPWMRLAPTGVFQFLLAIALRESDSPLVARTG
ncbi:MAG: thioredoxin domain-containing protein [Thermoguttaceae bacterium]